MLNGTPAGQPPAQLNSDSVENIDNIILLYPSVSSGATGVH